MIVSCFFDASRALIDDESIATTLRYRARLPAATHRVLQRLDEFTLRPRLHDELLRAGGGARHRHRCGIRKAGENDALSRRIQLARLLEKGETVHVGHAEIAHDHVE